MAHDDRSIYFHKEWIGMLQPVGLVVEPTALVQSQISLDRGKLVELQQQFKGFITEGNLPGRSDYQGAWLGGDRFQAFLTEFLRWPAKTIAGLGDNPLPQDFTLYLPDYGETLEPTYGVKDKAGDWVMLVKVVPLGWELDQDEPGSEQKWQATPQQKFERLLREKQQPVGLIFNGTHIRLVYAPRGEASGYLTFPVQAMMEVSGRLILGAMEMLLGRNSLLASQPEQRLTKVLEASRKAQAMVSEQLAAQVLDALWELLRGFESAYKMVQSPILEELSQNREGCRHIYGGLITTLMRLVFLLYAEERDVMPDDEVYGQHYSVLGLYERLVEENGTYPDTMDQRYGAWAGLLSLFRLVYEGGGPYEDYLPARHGQLFDPDAYPFLEGRQNPTDAITHLPQVSDGVVFRMLDKLLMLKGDRLSYRALSVEEIGSVYEGIMGFEVEVAPGPSLAVRPKDVVIDLAALLARKPADRLSMLKEAECKAEGKVATAVKVAKTILDLQAALDRRISHRTPSVLPMGSLYLQPGEERRRSGSHYTPQKLTQPIVETTLRPILSQLGEHPTAEQILSLKVCDLAMGSGAFLVETCRQLADELVKAWEREKSTPRGALDPLLMARRLVAQRCLYGVDKNPFAVNLAKLSLWLLTLSNDRPFTFVDHALKDGDSLVGLTSKEISSFTKVAQLSLLDSDAQVREQLRQVENYRRSIQETDTTDDDQMSRKYQAWQQVEAILAGPRLAGLMKVGAFFKGKNAKEREQLEQEYQTLLAQGTEAELEAIVASLQQSDRPLTPFHWEIEFPEVFDRKNPGFDAIVGNPPFAGKNTLINGHPDGYLDWLKVVHPESHGNADLVAHFFRRTFTILRKQGTFGLVSTNTVSQGDTRSSGLRVIAKEGCDFYNVTKRVKWQGAAAVVASVTHGYKGQYSGQRYLNCRAVNQITAFFFHDGGNDDPKVLLANKNKSFIGSYVLGMGFTFDDTNPEATPIAEMHRLIEKDSRNAECIFPYIGGEEVNSSPTHAHRRYVINLGEITEEEARKWPDLMAIVEEKVKPARLAQKREVRARYWWRFGETTPALFREIAECDRVLAISRVGNAVAFTFLPNEMVYAESLVVFPLSSYSSFGILQGRIHEIWARFLSSSMKDDLRYSCADCFETFPFPANWETDPALDKIGKTYYEYRADLMIRNNQGLTATYNRFHDPHEDDPDILKLRELHDQMDRAVLDAYGWQDIESTCGFALDYLDVDPEDLPAQAQERVESGDLFFSTAEEAAAFDVLVRSSQAKRGKLPWRYKWPEVIHDDVLARLLDLNQKRYDEEVRLGLHGNAKAIGKGTTKKKGTAKKKGEIIKEEQQGELLFLD
ncbi:MAG: Eco57I restriction-modification methylase domain-containing protein [Spirulina sp.]